MIMAASCIYLFTHNLHDYGYLLIVIAAVCILIPVAGIEVNNEVLVIKKYYLFTLLCKTTRFYKKGDILLQLFEIDLMDAGDEAAESGLLGLLFLSMPYKASIKKIIITAQVAKNKELKATVTLENTEYKLLRNFIGSK